MQNSDDRKAFLDYVETIFKKAARRHSTLAPSNSAQQTTTNTTQPSPTEPEERHTPTHRTAVNQLLQFAETGQPGIQVKGVALFMDGNTERLGISFCRVDAKQRVTISPGLANLLNGSTSRKTIKKGKFKDTAPTTIAGYHCRLVRIKNKMIVLIQWSTETPFFIANKLLSEMARGTEQIPKVISVDAMVVEYDRGEVADHIGCIEASKHHQIVVYEDRGEDLGHLRAPPAKNPPNTEYSQPSASTQSGSERLQVKIDTPPQKPSHSGTMNKRTLSTLDHTITSTIRHTYLDKIAVTAAAVKQFFAPRQKTPPPHSTKRTRADKGQVSAPIYITPDKPTDHAVNALLEFLAIERATKQVHTNTCQNIMQAYRRENEKLLQVRLEEAGAAIYNNDESQTIKGKMSGEYMTAYSSTSGFVPRDDAKTEQMGKPFFVTPPEDPLVVVAGCTRIMLQDKTLKMAETIVGPHSPAALSELWEMPNIKWINGVPGCGKTTFIVNIFDSSNDIILTTTIEAAKDLRDRVARLVTSGVKSKVRTMASVLANGFCERREKRLLVDEAHMNHFGGIIMAARLLRAKELVIVGDVNQLPYIDRQNLFDIRYSNPNTMATISQELFCTRRCPMDVAYALSEVYPSIYSSRSRVKSLHMERYTGTNIPPDQPNTLFLVLTQEEKSSLTSRGYGSGTGSKILTVHEAQGLTYDSVIIIQTKEKVTKLRSSVSHAVVAVSRHRVQCTYYTDDSTDTIGRFVRRAMEASEQTISQRNLRMAIKHRDEKIMQTTTPSV